MAKKAKGGLKLPKRLLGVKVPKQTRKHLNGLLKELVGGEANPLVAAAVGSMLAVVTERLGKPMDDRAPYAEKAARGARGGLGPGQPVGAPY